MLIFVNIVGTLFGFWYYKFQLASTPLVKLVFVPDCPIYTLLFACFLVLHFMGKKSAILATVTFIGLVKYGFWTVLVISLYCEYYAASDLFLYVVLFILHIGMIAQAYVIPQISGFSKDALMIALVWFLANDVMDYFFGTAPYLPDYMYHNLLFVESTLMTIILVIYSRKSM
ncbi:MAG: hypothetical protein DRN71_00020 [Candidatus Nanohalarchaeota archaeon]|nr:MAG: hypothetical protein DRN71_00020 [Candidatus Nanohaloarchaeota archaeon]